MKPTRRTIGWAAAAVATVLALPLVANAQSGSSTVPSGFHGGWINHAQDDDAMMADSGMGMMMTGEGIDHDAMMTGEHMDHDAMMTGEHMDHDAMMTGEGMGTMPDDMPSGGMTPAGPTRHERHHPDDSTGSESP